MIEMEAGYFGKVESLPKPDGVIRDFFDYLTLNHDYCPAWNAGFAIIIAPIEQLKDFAREEYPGRSEDIIKYIDTVLKPITLPNGTTHLLLNW